LTEGMTREQVQVFIDSHQSQQLGTLLGSAPALWVHLDSVRRDSRTLVLQSRGCLSAVQLQCNATQCNATQCNAMQRDAHGHPTLTAIDYFSEVQLLDELQDCL
jgi:hypothetical protein